jgi:hypothetical protein
MHLRLYNVAKDIPIGAVKADDVGRGAEASPEETKVFEQWLRARWTEKDQLMEYYHQHGGFPSAKELPKDSSVNVDRLVIDGASVGMNADDADGDTETVGSPVKDRKKKNRKKGTGESAGEEGEGESKSKKKKKKIESLKKTSGDVTSTADESEYATASPALTPSLAVTPLPNTVTPLTTTGLMPPKAKKTPDDVTPTVTIPKPLHSNGNVTQSIELPIQLRSNFEIVPAFSWFLPIVLPWVFIRTKNVIIYILVSIWDWIYQSMYYLLRGL